MSSNKLPSNSYCTMGNFFKIFAFISIVLTLATSWSCKEIDDWTKYQMSFISEAEISDTLRLSDDSTYVFNQDFFLDFQEELKKRAIREKQIESITLQDIILETVDGSVQHDFSFIKGFTMDLEGTNFGTRQVVSGDTLRINAVFGDFEINDKNDMQKLLEGDEFRVVFAFKLKKDLTVPLKFRLRARFLLDARQFFIQARKPELPVL